jgi:hypothetical protein
MNSETFIRQSARAGAYARNHSFTEVMNAHSHQPYAERLSKTIYGKLASAIFPQGIAVDGRDFRFLGAGAEQLVFATDTEVAKVITMSLTRERDRTEAETMEYDRNYATAKAYMHEHITDTQFDVRRLRGGMFAAVAFQPRLRAMREFADVNDIVNYRDDTVYLNQIQSLLDSLVSLYTEAGLQIDLNGVRNVFLTGEPDSPNLEVVDTIIVSPEMQNRFDVRNGQPVGETINGKMSLLSSAVVVRPILQT